MIPNGLFTQIAITVLSIGIIISYVKPTFDTIASFQDEIATYETEQASVSEVNSKLASLSAMVGNIPSEDQRRLLTYMPDTVDTIAVPRTLEAIANEAGVTLRQINYEEGAPQSNEMIFEPGAPAAVVAPTAEKFNMTIEASYDQLKRFLQLLEQNEYPLEVTQMEVSQVSEGFLTVGLTLTTYSLGLSTEDATINQLSI